MKFSFEVDNLHELQGLLAAIDKHRFGAVILLLAAVAVGAFFLLKH